MAVDAANNESVLAEYARDMRTAKYSEITIADRLRLLRCFVTWLDEAPILAAAVEDLHDYQGTFGHLSPASVDIYSRHLRAFYKWAQRRKLIRDDPSLELELPRLPRGRPHPAHLDQLTAIFRLTPLGDLRKAYALAAFTGLRRGEICRLQRTDLDLDPAGATALIYGKGGHQRIVPLLAPVVDELERNGLPRTGYVVRRHGKPYEPGRLSADSLRHLRSIEVDTTLHSLRHSWATNALRTTRDIRLVQTILGHLSLVSTQIYTEVDMSSAHRQLEDLANVAVGMLGHRPTLRVVGDE